ncbi:cation transport regulator ChaB [Candidatus Francisella endociliophora]|uniref:Cation transport regulator ChaB n=1 Tax=Candidatus Francisella endociliophora TaxID=653937 RepID=A0A097EM65_9GAMM|nr:ChaB family protein [Francisella sp. FSC1006]AIT08655.1 cation transport regulator ChaB [Francisella sp. FSC1006]
MPYNKIAELPKGVQNVLPKHAQNIYQSAFNNACTEYKDKGKRKTNEDLETIAHKVAWSAVEQQYYKDEETGNWYKK